MGPLLVEGARELVDQGGDHGLEYGELTVQTEREQHEKEEDGPHGWVWKLADGLRISDESQSEA